MAIQQRGERFVELVEIMDRLLGPGGCPWDREQTLTTLRPFLLEEAHEVLQALEDGDVAGHCEELGDLLLQIVFQAALRAAEGSFGIDDVARAICDKLVHRHPHVFGEVKVSGAGEVLTNWARLKAEEKADKGKAGGLLDSVPRSLPALLQAQRVGEKAASVRFDWPDAAGVRAKLDEEIGELDEAVAAGDAEAVGREIGDVLFTLTRLAAKLDVAPEDALRGAIGRFRRRFAWMEEEQERRGEARDFRGLTLEQMDVLWRAAKASTEG